MKNHTREAIISDHFWGFERRLRSKCREDVKIDSTYRTNLRDYIMSVYNFKCGKKSYVRGHKLEIPWYNCIKKSKFQHSN